MSTNIIPTLLKSTIYLRLWLLGGKTFTPKVLQWYLHVHLQYFSLAVALLALFNGND